MKKIVLSLLSASLLLSALPMNGLAQEESQSQEETSESQVVDSNEENRYESEEDHDHDHHDGEDEDGDHDHHHDHGSGSFSADDHHNHGTARANFLPAQILNPDDSVYEAPEEIADYVGTYASQVHIDELDADLHIIVNIEEDGILNLAYYFVNTEDNTGLRFYANSDGVVEERDALYQDLVVMTAALREGDGGLGTGLIGKTVSPVVLLDEEGEADRLYPYMALAFELRENMQNARVYQNIGLYAVDGKLTVDVNHLIGLESDQAIAVELEAVEASAEDALLVERRSYELLQDSFDNDLDADHNDFKMDYESANDFVQRVLAMHLRTNASFPQDTTVEMLAGDTVELEESLGADDIAYAFLLNDSILYAYDGSRLYMAEEAKETDGVYTSDNWISSN